jgi:hypothetical protein
LREISTNQSVSVLFTSVGSALVAEARREFGEDCLNPDFLRSKKWLSSAAAGVPAQPANREEK